MPLAAADTVCFLTVIQCRNLWRFVSTQLAYRRARQRRDRIPGLITLAILHPRPLAVGLLSVWQSAELAKGYVQTLEHVRAAGSVHRRKDLVWSAELRVVRTNNRFVKWDIDGIHRTDGAN
jgi:heme-degrading monooxygenase HmoA